MPQILSKKNGGIYKPKSDSEGYICPTFTYNPSTDKSQGPPAAQSEVVIPIVDVNANQQTPTCDDGNLPEDTKIGPPSTSSQAANYYLSVITQNTGRTEVCTYIPSALIAAKMQCNEWGLPSATISSDQGRKSDKSTSGLIHPAFIKHGSLIPRSSYLKKRRLAIDLGRRARVLGNFLQSIDEEEEHEVEMDMYFIDHCSYFSAVAKYV